MRELIDAFLEKLLVEHRLAANTVGCYRLSLLQWLEFCSGRALEAPPSLLQLTRPMVRLWLHALHDRELSKQTIALRMTSLRQFCRWLLDTGQIEENPALAVPLPKQRRHLPVVLTEGQMLKLLEPLPFLTFAGVREQAQLHVLYSTGCRLGELLALNVSDIDLERRRVKLFGSKSNQERLAFLYPAAVRALSAWLRWRQTQLAAQGLPEDGAAFCHANGRRESPRTVAKMVKGRAIIAGLSPEVSAHALRHSFASALLAHGCDLASLKVLMGHASLRTTGEYLTISPAKMLEVFRAAHPRA